jgi:hypothetical protein
MTWVILRWEFVRLTHQIRNIRKKYRAAGQEANPEALKLEQRKVIETFRKLFDEDYLPYLHPSRPYDWLCIAWIEGE